MSMPGVDFAAGGHAIQSSATKRQRPKQVSIQMPKYINRVDGKGFYLRFCYGAQDAQTVSNMVDGLYKNNIIDDSYIHLYSREARVVAHGIFHVTSRDYDFDFFRKTIPGCSFKMSRYPDKEYTYKSQTTLLESGVIENLA